MRSNVSLLAAYRKDNAGHELKVVVERVMRDSSVCLMIQGYI